MYLLMTEVNVIGCIMFLSSGMGNPVFASKHHKVSVTKTGQGVAAKQQSDIQAKPSISKEALQTPTKTKNSAGYKNGEKYFIILFAFKTITR